MTHKPLVIILNLQSKDFAIFILTLKPIFLDKCRWKLEFCLYKRIVAGHIVVVAVHIVVKHQANLADIHIALEAIFDIVALLADPQIAFAPVNAVANNLGGA